VLSTGALPGLASIKSQTCILYIASSFVCLTQLTIECCAPPNKELLLDLGILLKAGFTNFFFSNGVLFKRGSQTVFLYSTASSICADTISTSPGVGAMEKLRRGQGSTRDGVVECLRLGLG